jgi:hypothetical protein
MGIVIGIHEDKEFKQLVNGDFYECFVSAVDEPEFDTNKNAFKGSVNYKVRDDVHPDFAGAEIRYDYFNDAPNMGWKLNAVASAIGVPVGTSFETLKEFFDFIKAKPLMVKVALEPSQDGTKLYAKAKSYKPTELGEFVAPEGSMEEDDSDLPF